MGCFVYLQRAGSWFKYAISAAILTERQMRDVSASRTQFPCRTDPSRNALTRSETVIAASSFSAPVNVGFKRAVEAFMIFIIFVILIESNQKTRQQ